jgi:hypothetical protein
MQTLLSIYILSANVDMQSFILRTKDKGKRIKESAVTTLSKENKTEKKFLLSTHHMFYSILINE